MRRAVRQCLQAFYSIVYSKFGVKWGVTNLKIRCTYTQRESFGYFTLGIPPGHLLGHQEWHLSKHYPCAFYYIHIQSVRALSFK